MKYLIGLSLILSACGQTPAPSGLTAPSTLSLSPANGATGQTASAPTPTVTPSPSPSPSPTEYTVCGLEFQVDGTYVTNKGDIVTTGSYTIGAYTLSGVYHPACTYLVDGNVVTQEE